eukprot:CAMPEP_0116564326 /NCGR_PEP_ID=MMETSP0397-20121206/13243_1 /TAXON_ID=216820 /ORGANISM="Cyclophora tenuis, Strain ECT3854" /LENGTH=156 /DNA_ID=CAMNT_0004090901 /DNA_START=172 /DNA_END=642 /DNA_ORIENTATION=+
MGRLFRRKSLKKKYPLNDPNNRPDDESVYSTATTVKAGTCPRKSSPSKVKPAPSLTVVSEPIEATKLLWRRPFRKAAATQQMFRGKFESTTTAAALAEDHFVAQRRHGKQKRKEVPYTMKLYLSQQQRPLHPRSRCDSSTSTSSTASLSSGRFFEV